VKKLKIIELPVCKQRFSAFRSVFHFFHSFSVTQARGLVRTFFAKTDLKKMPDLPQRPPSLIGYAFGTGFDLKSKSRIQDPRVAREEKPQGDTANQLLQTIGMDGW